ncbi:thiamine pyrophosphate-binding protein [Amycolatopsis panacis]|uniref:Thiamine pyrophosphate-binding protein n=1 Tax=Amycolatopsis panacis TaxID=2340917 RepID=A0A419HZR8_9PSEU|nr:thiamine pyrophosphate-binding protein [Amycolatopsis panacis]RJQ82670.1 thiamine pyrophosphate-binding protein [Amycolatopsis panacis]
MTTTRVADIIGQILADQGIDTFFMLTGGDPALWTAFQRRGIRMIPCRSEQGAVYMADGYARITGRPTFVYGQHGPGSANVAAALADAYWAMSPVVSLTSSVPAATRDRHEYQLLDQLALHQPVTHWAGEARQGDHVRRMLLRAMHEAVSAPGPAHLDVPRDVIAETTEPEAAAAAPATRLAAPMYRPLPSAEVLGSMIDALTSARRLVILAGSGARVSGVGEEIAQLAELLQAPVVTSIGGKGSIADSHRLGAGVVGRYAAPISNRIAREADQVLVLGSRTGSVTSDSFTLFEDVPLIRVDTATGSLDPAAGLNVLGDVKATVAALIEALSADTARATAARDRAWLAECVDEIANWRAHALDTADTSTEHMHPREVVSMIADALDGEDIVVADTGYMAAWAGVLYPQRSTGATFLRAAGSLGWAIPGALGAQLAAPDRRVVCITGDGGAGYNLAELETAARVGIPATIVVMNNGTLAFEYHLQKYVEGNIIPEINDFGDASYADAAIALGARGVTVRTAAELAKALSEAGGAPTLIDARIDPEAIAPVTSYAASMPMPTGA